MIARSSNSGRGLLLHWATKCLVAAVLSVMHFPIRAELVEFDPSIVQSLRDPQGMPATVERVGSIHVIRIGDDYSATLPAQPGQHAARRSVAQAFFSAFPDDADFLIVFTDFDVDFGPLDGLHWGVRNDVQGIGRPLVDGSEAFGSNGRLRGYIDMGGRLSRTLLPVQHQYDRELNVLMHELMHQWGIYVRYRGIDGQPSDGLLGRDATHWSFFADTDASVMYGARWQQLGAEDHRSIGVLERFSPLDLYLAGFLPADAVPPTRLIRSMQGAVQDLPRIGATATGPVETIDVAQIIAHEGARIPDVATAPKEFTARFVLLVRDGFTPRPETLGRLEVFRLQSQMRFAALTLGRGVLSSRVAATGAGGQVGSPGGVGSAAPTRMDVDMDLAAEWLSASQFAAGYWQDKRATRLIDTAMAAEAIGALGGGADSIQSATAWLGGARRYTIEEQATALRSGLLEVDDAGMTAQQLASSYMPDSGWGLTEGFVASTVDTALAVEALLGLLAANPSSFPDEQIAAWREAVPGQMQEHCWTVHAEVARCSLLASARAIRALAASGLSHQDALSAVDRLQDWQHSDGGFGEGASTEAETAEVLLALAAISAPRGASTLLAEDYLSRRQRVDGSWSGSVATTAKAVRALLSAQRPDLRARGVEVESAQPVVPGDVLSIRIHVDNAGAVPIPASGLRVRYVNQEQPDIAGLIPTLQSVPPLEPLQQEILYGDWSTEGLPPGTYRIRAMLDPDNEIDEADEHNNAVELVQVLSAPPQLPDLDFAPTSVSIEPSVLVQLPATVTLEATIRNRGLTHVPATSIRVGVARGPVLQVVAEVDVLDIAPLSARSLEVTFDIVHADATAILLEIDPDDLIVEANESNNQGRVPLRREPTVDLALESGDLQVTPDAPLTGEDVELEFVVRNRGTELSPQARLLVEARMPGQSWIVADQQVQVAANSGRVLQLPWRPQVAGSHQLVLTIDPDDLVPELNEENNQIVREALVTASTLPNLMVRREDLTVTPDPPLQGQPLQVSARVLNTGSVAAEPFTVGFYLGDPTQGGERFAEVPVGVGLEPGAHLDLVAQLPALERVGEQVVSVRADDGMLIDEVNEADNVAQLVRTIRRLPDLSLREGDIVLEPSAPVAGESNRVVARVANVGQQPAGSFMVAAFLGRPEAGGPALAAPVSVDGLAPGASRLVEFHWQPAPDLSEASITLLVDPEGAVREGDEFNNRAEVPFNVRDANHYLTEEFFSPDGDGVKDRTRIVARFQEPTDVQVRIVADWGEEVRRFEGPELLGAVSLTLEWDGLRGDGTRAYDGEYSVLVERNSGALIRRHRLVLDTNRLPLLLAAGTSYEMQTPLACGLEIFGEDAGEAQFTSDPRGAVLGRARPPGEQHFGLFEAPLDGRPLRQLLSPADLEFQGRQWTLEQWRIADAGREVLALARDATGPETEIRVFRIDLRRNAMVVTLTDPLPGSLHRSQLLGRTANGDIYVMQGSTLNAWRAGNQGHWQTTEVGWHLASEVDGGRFDLGEADLIALMHDDPYGGSLAWVQVDLSGVHSPRVLASAGAFGDGMAYRPTAHLDRSRGYFFIASGHRADGAEYVEAIDLQSGASQRLLEAVAMGGVANLTLTYSPFEGRLLVFDGRGGLAYSIDMETGESHPIDLLSEIDPGVASTGNGLNYFDDFRWSEDGRRLVFDYVEALPGGEQSPHGLGLTSGCCWSRVPATLEVEAPLESPARLLLHPGGSGVAMPPFSPLPSPSGAIGDPLKVLPMLPGEPQFVLKEADYWDVGSSYAVTPVRSFRTGQMLQGRRIRSLGATPSGRSLLVGATENASCPGGDLLAVENLMNSTTRLQVEHVQSLGSLELRITAMDRYLDRYVLEYRPVGENSDWQGILAERRGVVDEVVGYWAPPAPGWYDIRLTLHDSAGNVQSTRQQVAWFDLSALGTVRLSNRHFSPNGDGIKDTTAAEFTLYRPAQFEVRVEDAQGGVLRSHTLTFASASPGTQSWQWDGRDQVGQRVPDGRYRIVVDGRVLWVTVDTLPPEASFDWRSYFRGFKVACESSIGPDPEYHCRTTPSLRVLPHLTPGKSRVIDAHLSTVHLEWADRSAPDAWGPLAELLPQQPGVYEGLPSHHLLSDHQAFNFRLRAEDAAGNLTLRPLTWTPELFLTGMVEYAAAGGERGWLARTVVHAVTPDQSLLSPDAGISPGEAFRGRSISSNYPIDQAEMLFLIADTRLESPRDVELWLAEDPRTVGSIETLSCSALNALNWQRVPHVEVSESDAAVRLSAGALAGAQRAFDEGWRVAAVHAELFRADQGYLLRLGTPGQVPAACDALPFVLALAEPSAFHAGGDPQYRYGTSFGQLRLWSEQLRSINGPDVAIDLRTLYAPLHWDILSARVDWQWRTCEGETLVEWDRLDSSIHRTQDSHVLFDSRGMNFGGLPYLLSGEEISGPLPRYTLELTARNRWRGEVVSRRWQQAPATCRPASPPPSPLVCEISGATRLQLRSAIPSFSTSATYRARTERAGQTHVLGSTSTGPGGDALGHLRVDLTSLEEGQHALVIDRMGVGGAWEEAARHDITVDREPPAIQGHDLDAPPLLRLCRFNVGSPQCSAEPGSQHLRGAIVAADNHHLGDVVLRPWVDGQPIPLAPSESVWSLNRDGENPLIRNLNEDLAYLACTRHSPFRSTQGTVEFIPEAHDCELQASGPPLPVVYQIDDELDLREIRVNGLQAGDGGVDAEHWQYRTPRIDNEGTSELIPWASIEVSHLAGWDATFSMVLGEPAFAVISLVPVVPAVHGWQIDGPPLLTLLQGPLAAGPWSWIWDGRDEQGQPAPDGHYALRLQLDDECGHGRDVLVPVRVDNSPPVIDVAYPQNQAVLGPVEEIEVAVVDPGLGVIALHYRPDLPDESWRLIARNEPIEDRFLPGAVRRIAWWNTSALPSGSYQLRVQARDGIGHASESVVAVELPAVAPLLRDARAQPEVFSPNGDGLRDVVEVTVDLAVGARAWLEAYRLPDNVLVVGLADALDLPPGITRWQWDGRPGNGAVLSDGRYALRLRVQSLGDPGQQQVVQLPVAIDTQVPSIVLSRPENGHSQGQEAIHLGVVDAHPRSFQAWLQPPVSGAQWSGTQFGLIALAGIENVPEGAYALQVEASDRAENTGYASLPLTIDRTPPEAELRSPVAGAHLRAGSGPVALRGRASDNHFAGFRLGLAAPGQSPAISLLESGAPPVDDLFMHWLPDSPDGEYDLVLTVQDLAGWQTERRVDVVVDNTPPWVDITEPVQDGFAALPLRIQGTVTDAHLQAFQVQLAPGGSEEPSWSSVATGVAEVTDGLLAQLDGLPAEGEFRLRVLAKDKAGNESEQTRRFRIDTIAPPTPGMLVLERIGPAQIRLGWQPVSVDDLAGYRVLRNGLPHALVPVGQHSYDDTGLADGEYRYRLVAVDQAGNASVPSNEVRVRIDTTPPEATILEPRAGERVRADVEVWGTAFSLEDFRDYALDALSDLPAVRLAESTSPVRAGRLAVWDTLAFALEAPAGLSLIARDQDDNQSSDVIPITVDNLPPAAPVDLVVTAEVGGGSRLDWSPNTEADLVGYLVYRGGRLLNGEATADPRQVATGVTTWLDALVGDGIHEYRVVAVDLAANLSEPSDPAQIAFEGRPPTVDFERPAENETFDHSVLARVRSEHTDIVHVQFAVRAVEGGDWSALGDPVSSQPWQAFFEPSGLPHGDYEIRATASDSEGLTDPDPPVRTVRYRDLTAPGPVTALSLQIDGGDVLVSWVAPDVSDLDRFEVRRRQLQAGQGFQVVAEPPAGTTSVTDPQRPDALYEYVVVAIDQAGNRSLPATVMGRVHTPQVDYPYTPTDQIEIQLCGRSDVTGAVQADRTVDGVTTALPAHSTDDKGTFCLGGVEALIGRNDFRVRIVDADGQRSKPALVVVHHGLPPAHPDPVQVLVEDYLATVSWPVSGVADLLGFRVFRNGEAVLGDVPVVDAGQPRFGYGAEDDGLPAPFLFDSNPATRYEAWLWEPQHLWVEQHYASAKWIPAVEVDLAAVPGQSWRPVRVQVSGWSGHAWIDLAQQLVTAPATVALVFDKPYVTERLRIELHPADDFAAFNILDVHVIERPVLTGGSWQETLGDGIHHYRVSTVHAYGFEGPRSPAVEARVGDWQAPEPVELSAQVSGSDVTLSWTSSLSEDVDVYLLMRRGLLLASYPATAPRLHVDIGLSNGSYDYQVLVRDLAGNLSAPSNRVDVLIAQEVPGAPVDLIATAVPGGGAIDLAWQAGTGPLPESFRLFRSTSAGGPYLALLDVPVASHRDVGLENGRRYYYVVRAADALGNLSAPSNEASATPATAQALSRPRWIHPGPGGSTVSLANGRTFASGWADPAAAVALRVAGTIRATANATDADQVEIQNAQARVHPSPDGRHLIADYWGGLELWRRGEGAALVDLGSVCGPPQWLDADNVLLCRWGAQQRVVRYTLATGGEATLLGMQGIEAYSMSPDRRTLFVAGTVVDGDDQRVGLWLHDSGIGEPQFIEYDSPWRVSQYALQWSEDARFLSWLDSQTGEYAVLDRVDGQLRTLPVGGQDPASPIPGEDLLLVAGQGPDGPGAYRADPTTGSVQLLALDGVPPRSVSLSPDGSLLAHLGADGQLVLRTWPGLQELRRLEAAPEYSLAFMPNGELLLHSGLVNPHSLMMRLAGHFQTAPFDLPTGVSELSLLASKPGHGGSPPSLSLWVQVASALLPDLALLPGDVVSLPSVSPVGVPGQALIQLRNLGPVGAPSTRLQVRVLAPGNIVFHETTIDVPPIPAFGSQALALTLPGAVEPGQYRILAFADADQAVVEVDEANNLGIATWLVARDDRPELALDLSHSSLAPGAVLSGQTIAFGVASAFNGRLAVRILDAQGYLVAALAERPLSLPGAGAQAALDFIWSSAGVMPGNYTVQARLRDSGGALIRSLERTVSVRAEMNFAVSVHPDADPVPAGAPMEGEVRIHYTNGNALLSAAQLRIRLMDHLGAVLDERHQTVASLVPGDHFQVRYNLGASPAMPGVYQVSAALLDGQVLGQGTSSVQVLPATGGGLRGSLLLPAAPIPLGEDLVLHYRLENTGSQSIEQLAVRLHISESSSGAEIGSLDETLDLPAGASFDGEMTVSASLLGVGHYRVALDRTDVDPVAVLAFGTLNAIDVLPPFVEFEAPSNGAVVPGAIDVQVRVTDQHSGVSAVRMRVDQGPWLGMSALSQHGSRFTRHVNDLPEGAVNIEVQAEDSAGNASEIVALALTVDRTSPQVLVEGVQEGEHYNHAVQPLVVASDAHLSSLIVSLNGEAHENGSPILAEGGYLLLATARDAAGNRTEIQRRFEIDLTAPAVVYLHPAPGALIMAEVVDVEGQTEALAQVLLVNAGFSAQIQADPTGAFRFESVPLALGENTLVASAIDRAGNQGEPTTLVVQRIAPGVGELTGQVMLEAPSVNHGTPIAGMRRLNNVGPGPLEQIPVRLRLVHIASGEVMAVHTETVSLAAGEELLAAFSFASEALLPQAHRVALEAQLMAGRGTASWILLDDAEVTVLDAQGPELVVLSPAVGAVVASPLEVRVQATDLLSGIANVEANLNDQGWQALVATGVDDHYLGLLVGDEGPAQLRVRARDGAGNESQTAGIALVIDSLPPLIALEGVLDGQLANTPLTPVITVEDPYLQAVDIRLNGQAFASGTTVSLEGAHLLEVQADDAAGNTSTLSARFTLDFTPPTVVITSPPDGSQVNVPGIAVVVQSETLATVELSLLDLTLQLTTDADGQAVFKDVPLAPGDNSIQARARDAAGNWSLPTGITVTRVPPGSPLLVGSLSGLPATTMPGQPVNGSWLLGNQGGAESPSLHVRLRAIQALGVLQEETWSLPPLSPGDSVSEVFSLQTQAWLVGDVEVVMDVRPQDQPAGDWQVLAGQTLRVKPAQQAALHWIVPEPDSTVGGVFQVEVLLSDAPTPATLVELRVDDLWQPMQADVRPDHYVRTVSLRRERWHDFHVRAWSGPDVIATLGPIRLCVDLDRLFAHDFEASEALFRNGFELGPCPLAPDSGPGFVLGRSPAPLPMPFANVPNDLADGRRRLALAAPAAIRQALGG